MVGGVPGLVGFQYLVDKMTPLRFANELEKALVESLRPGGGGSLAVITGKCVAAMRRSSAARSASSDGNRSIKCSCATIVFTAAKRRGAAW